MIMSDIKRTLENWRMNFKGRYLHQGNSCESMLSDIKGPTVMHLVCK